MGVLGCGSLQRSCEERYNGQANVQSQVAGAVDAQTLPFTGLSLALIVGVAVLLLVSGIMLRRASRRAR